MVLLVNFGAPRTLDEVPYFLRAMTGREIPEEMVQAVTERYRAIGGGSPLPSITDQQAQLLSEQMGGQLTIRGAFRYSHPTIEEMINECYLLQIERLVFLVMSPYYNSRTVGSYSRAVESYLVHLPYRPATLFITSWYREPLFVESWVSRIREEAPGKEAFYLFSAHSLPESMRGEPYVSQVTETVESIAARLGITNYGIAWQSASQSPEEPWIGPSVEAVMDQVAGKFLRLIEVPIGFVSDHLETLYDIDIAHRNYAGQKGFVFSRIPSLNTYPLFITALKAILGKSLQESQ